ncbi:MAG: hypothetical protein ACREBQ_13150 [Nitrososphaerales archaeon]
MAILGFGDVLTLVQTVAIIGTLGMTLYFSRRQAQSIALDLETRVLNDLDEKLHHLVEIFIGSPEFVKIIYNVPSNISSELPVSYYVLFMCSHVYHMHQRKVLSDNEWTGWLQWMKNAFKYGTMRNTGKRWIWERGLILPFENS